MSLGVEPGDRVAIFMPMSPAAAVASHACAHIGAVQVPIFSGFAAPAILQRLRTRRRRSSSAPSHSLPARHTRTDAQIADEAVRDAPTVQHVVEWERDGGDWPGRARAGRAPAARGRLGASIPPRLYVGHDGPAEGRAARARRVPRLDRPRGGVPDRRQAGRPRPLRDGHGLDHGAVDGRRRRRVRRGGDLSEGAPDWPTTVSGARSRTNA